jgi:hypothetical protein
MAKPVYKYTKQMEYVCRYPNMSAAANDLGLNESSIRRAITEDRLVLGKYKFSDTKIFNENVINVFNSGILLLDVETSPMRGYIWNVWNTNVYQEQLISDFFILSWSAKWLGDYRIYSEVLSSEQVLNEDDSPILANLWELINKASIVITHNGKKFDMPRINARFLVNGIMPPAPYRQIDTLQIARSEFGFTRNSLDSIAETLGLKGKIKVDFNLWKECMKGNTEHLNKLCEYNENDILVLEEVYLKLRPFAKNHPNLDLFIDSDKPHCPHCGSPDLNTLDKYFFTQSNRYNVYRCNSCSAISRSKQGIKFNNKKVISPIPR